MDLKKIDIYGVVLSGGDGSAYPEYYLTYNQIEKKFSESCGGMGELCSFRVETYVGSNIHKRAEENKDDFEVDDMSCY